MIPLTEDLRVIPNGHQCPSTDVGASLVDILLSKQAGRTASVIARTHIYLLENGIFKIAIQSNLSCPKI